MRVGFVWHFCEVLKLLFPSLIDEVANTEDNQRIVYVISTEPVGAFNVK